MARRLTRGEALRRMQAAAAEPSAREDLDLQRTVRSPELQQASDILAQACRTLAVGGGNTAFTARTHTPLLAPPGWLPPPI